MKRAMTDAQFERAVDVAWRRLQRAYVDLEEELFQLQVARDECLERKARKAAA